MAKEKITKPEEEALGAAMSKTESFFEQNGKMMTYCLAALLILAGCVFGYKKLVSEPRIEKAAEMMIQAETRFAEETTDFELALSGDENGAGFLEIAEQYGSTPSGNLAKHCAGICYFRLGDMENAAKWLKKYSPVKGLPGAIINAQNLGLQGDILFEAGDYAAAAKLYIKASESSDNTYTTPLYLRKAALAEKALGNNKVAEEYLQRILNEYPSSNDAREAEKLLGANN
ncbi:MAG: tetratricopeptide repeat protein [Alistipes sp.]|nr:tetratricopeptide repeat protein [Alistipes sp.]